MKRSVAEIEQELAEAKRTEQARLHAEGVAAGQAAVKEDSFFRTRLESFKADMDMDHYNFVMCNRLQGGGHDRDNVFEFSDKTSGFGVKLTIGQRQGGWQPYYSVLYCIGGTDKKAVVFSFDVRDSKSDMDRPSFHVSGKSHAEKMAWYADLEVFLSAYYKVTKRMQPDLVIDYLRLALLGQNPF